MSDASEPQPKKQCSTLGEPPGLSLLYPHRDLLYYLMGFLDHKEKLQFSLVNKHVLGVYRQKHMHKLRLHLPAYTEQLTASKELLAFPAVCVENNDHLEHWIKLQRAQLGRGRRRSPLVDVRTTAWFRGTSNLPGMSIWSGLTHLRMEDGFNQALGVLPAALVYIKLGRMFTCVLDNLPSGLEHLECNGICVASRNVWPASLRHLNLYSCYTPLTLLPPTLTTLRINTFHKLPPLPPMLVELTEIHQTCGITVFPPTLTHLGLGAWHTDSVFSVPPSVTSLCCDRGFYGQLSFAQNNVLTKLALGEHCNVPFMALPASLVVLDMSESRQEHWIGVLPDALERLYLGWDYNQPLGPLPPSLKELRFGGAFNQSLGPLPLGLIELCIGDKFCKPLEPLPPRLKTLRTGNAFASRIEAFPETLVKLSLGASYKWPVGPLPPRLEYLSLNSSLEHSLGLCPPTIKRITINMND
jgi:hypothetical protein